jgi:hypothetical protein
MPRLPKCLLAHLANVRSLIGVNSSMANEVIFPREASIALLAVKRLVFRRGTFADLEGLRELLGEVDLYRIGELRWRSGRMGERRTRKDDERRENLPSRA